MASWQIDRLRQSQRIRIGLNYIMSSRDFGIFYFVAGVRSRETELVWKRIILSFQGVIEILRKLKMTVSPSRGKFFIDLPLFYFTSIPWWPTTLVDPYSWMNQIEMLKIILAYDGQSDTSAYRKLKCLGIYFSTYYLEEVLSPAARSLLDEFRSLHFWRYEFPSARGRIVIVEIFPCEPD